MVRNRATPSLQATPQPGPGDHPGGPWSRKEAASAALLFLLALAVRLLYLYESSDNPTFSLPIVDSKTYHDLASQLAAGRSPKENIFWQSPFYPVFLAAMYYFTDFSLTAVRIVQAALGALTCLLTFVLGRKLFGYSHGVLAAVITALYGPLVFYDGEILSTGIDSFWAAALILLFLETEERRSRTACFILGLCGGLSVLTRPTYLPFFLAGSAWLIFSLSRNAPGRGMVRRTAPFILVGWALIIAAAASLNHRTNGEWSFMPYSGGINVYIGNNPSVCDTLNTRPGKEWAQLANLPFRSGARNPREASDFFYGKVFDYAYSQPASFLSGLVRKTAQLVNSREMPRNVEIYSFRQWSGILKLLLWKAGPFGFPFGILLPFATIGIYFAWRSTRAPMHIFLLLYPSAIIAVFVTSRYRMPIVPPLAVMAAAGFIALTDAVQRGRWERVCRAVLIAGVVVFLSSVPGPFCEEKLDYNSELYAITGNMFRRTGDYEQAEEYLNKALERMPDYVDAHNWLGITYVKTGNLDEAVRHFSTAVSLNPDYGDAHNNLGGALMQKGHHDEAFLHFQQALRTGVTDAQVYLGLATTLRHLGRRDEAIGNYRVWLKFQPDDFRAHYNLAELLFAKGVYPEAEFHYREALRVNPGEAEIYLSLGKVLAKLGKHGESAEYVARAITLKPALRDTLKEQRR